MLGILPSGTLQVGGEMIFLVADALPRVDPERVELTDLALFRVSARRAFGDHLELQVGTLLLPKQPVGAGQPLWQGADLSARVAFIQELGAFTGAAGGPLVNGAGAWWQLAPGLTSKFEAARYMRLGLDLSGPLTVLHPDEPEGAQWLQELSLGGEAQLGEGNGAGWLRLDYFVPIATGGSGSGPNGTLDPQVRLTLEIGGVLTFSDGWDIFAVYRIVDRGEIERPETTLPIIDGGFDQHQITIGIQHRFEGHPPSP